MLKPAQPTQFNIKWWLIGNKLKWELNCSSQSQAQLVDASCPKRMHPHFPSVSHMLFLRIYFNGGNLGLRALVLAWLLAFIFATDSQSLLTSSICSKCEHLIRVGLESNATAEIWTSENTPSLSFRNIQSRTPLTISHSHPYSANPGMEHACLLLLLVPSPDTNWGAYSMQSPLLPRPSETYYPK